MVLTARTVLWTVSKFTNNLDISEFLAIIVKIKISKALSRRKYMRNMFLFFSHSKQVFPMNTDIVSTLMT